MLPADDINCARANFVCPECAPDFVIANSTTFTDVEDPLISEEFHPIPKEEWK
jgi:hypothetical protein